jgi:hypothetical protein
MINLYIQYFKHKKDDRRKELDYCTKHNIKNPAIDKVYILLENEEDKQDWMINPKVVVTNFGKRMTFRNFVEYSNSVDSNDVHIVTNLDMFFDNDLIKLKENNIDNHLVTLTRWNIDVTTKKANFFNVNCSQDTWIWKGVVDLSKFDLDYFFGTPGIDNAVCGEFHETGYKVINPSLDLKSYHLHQDTTRGYTDDDVVRKRLYLLYPTKDWNQSQIQYWKDCTNFTPTKTN